MLTSEYLELGATEGRAHVWSFLWILGWFIVLVPSVYLRKSWCHFFFTVQIKKYILSLTWDFFHSSIAMYFGLVFFILSHISWVLWSCIMLTSFIYLLFIIFNLGSISFSYLVFNNWNSVFYVLWYAGKAYLWSFCLTSFNFYFKFYLFGFSFASYLLINIFMSWALLLFTSTIFLLFFSLSP